VEAEANRSKRVLLIEDDPSHALMMQKCLRSLGGVIEHARTRAEAIRLLSEDRFDVVVLDVGLPDGSGFDVHDWLREQRHAPPVVFVTADDRAEHAVNAVRSGAAHYVIKRPNYLDRMLEAVGEALEAEASVAGRWTRTTDSPPLDRIVGESPAIREIRRLIQEWGPHEVPVLISGETGTGKELVAQGLHHASARARRPFVTVNCAAITSSLFEAEVFGSMRGAFTGATRDRRGLVGAANAGTLFLDEVGELPWDAQAKLLRLVEEGRYRPVGAARESRADVRVLAATNRNLQEAVESGEFRPDLYYRLNVLRVHIAPLRERPEDIPLLANHFLAERTAEREQPSPTPAAIAKLMAWSWPGNARELKHVVERTYLRCRGGTIVAFDLDDVDVRQPATRHSVTPEALKELLTRHRGRLGPVANELCVSVRTLQRRMKELDLRPRDFRTPRLPPTT
jgi:DNA-binding NtrC family response regulator